MELEAGFWLVVRFAFVLFGGFTFAGRGVLVAGLLAGGGNADADGG